MEQKQQYSDKHPVVVGLGEILWDMLPTGKKVGGAPANFVYHATQLGAEGFVVSAIGKDDLGDELLRELDDHDIKHLVDRVPYPTGTVEVSLEDGLPTYEIKTGVAWDHILPTMQAVDLVEQADAVCFGTLAQRSIQSREAIRAILSFVSKDAYCCFDINLRQRYYSKELIEESLYLANVLKINDEELDVLRSLLDLNGTEEEIALWLMEKYTLRMVVVTAGSKYSAIYTPEEISRIQTPSVKVMDSVGAGDAFTGALIVSLLKGSSLKDAHQYAVKIAAYVCTKSGAWVKYS